MTAKSPTPLLSLVVLSFGRYAQTTGPCMASLLANVQGVLEVRDQPVEVVLVDNGSPDDAASHCARLAAAHPAVRWCPLPHNLGFGGGMNAGVAEARGDWVCLVNSDTLFPPGSLQALLDTLARCPPKVGLVGPVTNAAGNGQCLRLPDLGFDDVVRVGAAQMARPPTGLLTPTYRSDFFCVAVRRSVWMALNGLDPVFGKGYYEDFDFSLRVRAAGFEQVIAEDVFIAHVGSASFSGLRAEQQALLRRNRALMIQRHPGVRFESVREGNATVLRHLVTQAEQGGWTEALKQRAAWRWAALQADEPRSPLKRLRWRWSTRGLRHRLGVAGITARFPDPHDPHDPGSH